MADELIKSKLGKDLPLYISNKIVEAHFALPLGEQRLLYAYISKLSEEHMEFPEVEISVKEFSELLEVELNYKVVKERCKKILERVVEIETDELWMGFQWFSTCQYWKNEGRLILKAHEQLKPYLLRLKKEFTRLVTSQVMQFKSVYSIRIYMLSKQYQNIGKRLIPLEELRKKLGIEPGQYLKYNDFKRYVLIHAQKEINAHSDIEIEFQEVKRARKVVEIVFLINKNNKTEVITQGIESFVSKSMAELATMLCFEIKKRWKIDFPVSILQFYKKSTIIELTCAILRGAYDEKVIPAPNAYFKAGLDNIESGKGNF